MKSLKLLFALGLFLMYTNSNAQLTASFYQNNINSKFAVGYEFSEKLWADVRIYSGTSIDDITPEFVLNYNFIRKENYFSYVGGGVILNNINGIVLPLGIGIKPFENLKNFSINIEFNPIYEFDLNDLFLTGFIGIRYRFN